MSKREAAGAHGARAITDGEARAVRPGREREALAGQLQDLLIVMPGVLCIDAQALRDLAENRGLEREGPTHAGVFRAGRRFTVLAATSPVLRRDEATRHILGRSDAVCANVMRRARGCARRAGRSLTMADLLTAVGEARGGSSPEAERRTAVNGSGHMAGRAAEVVVLAASAARAAAVFANATRIANAMQQAGWGVRHWLSVRDLYRTSGRLRTLVKTEVRQAFGGTAASLEARRGRLDLLADALLARRAPTGVEATGILSSDQVAVESNSAAPIPGAGR